MDFVPAGIQFGQHYVLTSEFMPHYNGSTEWDEARDEWIEENFRFADEYESEYISREKWADHKEEYMEELEDKRAEAYLLED